MTSGALPRRDRPYASAWIVGVFVFGLLFLAYFNP